MKLRIHATTNELIYLSIIFIIIAAMVSINIASGSLLFNDGNGVVKLVFGTSFPVTLADRQRSVTAIHNFQIQYIPPPTPLYWWSVLDTTTLPTARHTRDTALHEDASRTIVYAAIEQLLDSKGLPGNSCLLKAICSVAQLPIDSSNLFHAVLNAILSPAAANIAQIYLDAQAAGRNGVDCSQTFSECPQIVEWLEGISFYP